MRSLIHKTSIKIFGFIFLTIFILFASSLKKFFPYAINKYEKKIYAISDIDIGIYGHSHSKGGIDASYMSEKTSKKIFNFSNAGTSLFYNIRLIENNLKFNSEHVVILEIGSNNIGYNGMIRSLVDSEFNSYGFSPFMHYLANNYQFLSIKDLKLFFFISPFKTLQSLIKGSFIFPNLYTGIDINEPSLENSIKTIDDLKASINQEWEKPVDINFEFNELRKLIMRYPETSFLLLRIPEHPLSLEVYGNEIRFDSLKKEFNKFSNVKFKDYSYMIFDNIDYKDISHLSKYGMKKFSDSLVNKIKELNIID